MNFVKITSIVTSIAILQLAETAQANPVKRERTNSQTPLSEIDRSEQDFFGTKGQGRWYIQGAAAANIDDRKASRFGLLGVGISQFFANGHSISAELNNMFFSQNEEDALGLNLSILLRWHFYRQPNWSIYFDGGAGILGTTNNVPNDSASFNFTPQVGGGASIKLKDEKRLLIGLRWHHISHANLFENNPGRDSLMGYIGIDLPR
jgi:lipid A 3-O-deacylase